MFQVANYKHPEIFVTSRRTAETFKFTVRNDGTVVDNAMGCEASEARRAAMAYLFRERQAAAQQPVLH
jgi:hypothetical protein